MEWLCARPHSTNHFSLDSAYGLKFLTFLPTSKLDLIPSFEARKYLFWKPSIIVLFPSLKFDQVSANALRIQLNILVLFIQLCNSLSVDLNSLTPFLPFCSREDFTDPLGPSLSHWIKTIDPSRSDLNINFWVQQSLTLMTRFLPCITIAMLQRTHHTCNYLFNVCTFLREALPNPLDKRKFPS